MSCWPSSSTVKASFSFRYSSCSRRSCSSFLLRSSSVCSKNIIRRIVLRHMWPLVDYHGYKLKYGQTNKNLIHALFQHKWCILRGLTLYSTHTKYLVLMVKGIMNTQFCHCWVSQKNPSSAEHGRKILKGKLYSLFFGIEINCLWHQSFSGTPQTAQARLVKSSLMI